MDRSAKSQRDFQNGTTPFSVGDPCLGKFGRLLLKHRQVQRNAPPHVLLDVSPSATPAEAKRALKQLACVLHPDRFANTDAALQRASARVFVALIAAEQLFRSRCEKRPAHSSASWYTAGETI